MNLENLAVTPRQRITGISDAPVIQDSKRLEAGSE